MLKDDSAVSETLGYILLFAIALTAIAIILLVGNSVITKEKSQDNFQNMEQSFTIIQSDLNQIALDGAPVKTANIHMEDGSLGVNEDSARVQVSYHNTNYDIKAGQIIFTQGENVLNNISIENGGVWKASDGYTYITSQPRIYVTPQTKTLVLNIYRMTTPGGTPNADSGIGTVNLVMQSEGTVVTSDAQPNGMVDIKIDTKYPEAWKEYINNMVEGTTVNANFVPSYSNGIEVQLTPVNNLLISEHQIQVTMSGVYV